MKKLAIITTHPIQYNAPLFRLLHERGRIAVKVFYTWGQSKDAVYDARFGIKRSWDIPLLEGYDHVFVRNTSRRPDSNRFFGVINPGLIAQLKQEQFDAILVYRWSLYSHFRILQSFGGMPRLFFRGDSHLLAAQPGLKHFLKRLVTRFVYRKTDAAFYVGAHNRQYYLNSGFKPEQLRYAAHAIDNNRFSAHAGDWEKEAEAERMKLGIGADDLVFLYAGKFYDVKNLPLLIRAFQATSNKAYRLLLVGNGEQEEELKKMAARDERILFTGFRNQTEMPLVYRLGDVFLLPSKRETWGLSVNEAMACSRPAIVSDLCGCAPELIVEGVTGQIFQSGNMPALVQTLHQFTTRQMALAMGAAAFKHVQAFSLERVAGVIEGEVEGLRLKV
nr:glycosyltransferase family 4 protein [uncultured Lacibacter sp.]